MSRDMFGDVVCDHGCGASIIGYFDDTEQSILVRSAQRGWTRHEGCDYCPRCRDISNTHAPGGLGSAHTRSDPGAARTARDRDPNRKGLR